MKFENGAQFHNPNPFFFLSLTAIFSHRNPTFSFSFSFSSMANQRNSDEIKIAVKDQQNATLYYKMNKNLPIRKVLAAFCERKQVDYRTVTILFDGARIQLNKTPLELNMENNDEIQVMYYMSGGGYP